MSKISTVLVGTAIVLLGILGGVLPAGAQPAQRPIGRDQGFVGLVNDHTVNATVQVLCPGGPIRIGERGHPVAGQTVGVSDVAASAALSLGFTGKRAHSITAAFTPTPTVSPLGSVTFTTYGDQPLPTTLSLPCYGSAAVLFVPRPTSPTARSARVTVTYLATCGSVVCPVLTRHRLHRPI
ncbi:MAG TPA: hypothetical protein VNC61_13815 [Acidimicrobiales bacterium]|nr:hypothetical protein [Acidimicrobiales bacterium]